MSRQLLEGLDPLPHRIFLEGEREPIPDFDGFILPIGTVLTPRDLLQQAAVLAFAPPWTGKTTVAKGVFQALAAHPFSTLTCFEACERGASVEPPWWETWRDSGDPAFWIVDAVDEDARKDKQSVRILQLLRELPAEARARLRLSAFCRINEVPPWFEQGLEAVYGPWSPDRPHGLRRLRLAGLDRESARAHVGPGRFERVCRLIRWSSLQPLASYPAVLQYLAERGEDENLSRDTVWEGVLIDLLREKRDRSEPAHPLFQSEVEDRFAVAQRLAALTTFGGIDAIRPENGLENLFPATIPGYAELRMAARETWKTSLFERSERGYRFCQDHVRQWLTAFALRDLKLLQLRPLLMLESGELDPSHEGVAGLLEQISRHPDVREWIAVARGGLPASEAAFGSLPAAKRTLDRLQEIGRAGPRGTAVWREDLLRSLGRVPGIGGEIARRLEGALHPAEQRLLLDLAFEIGAREALPPALRLLREEGGDDSVRALAAKLVAAFGTEEHLRPLVPWIAARPEAQDGEDAALPILAAALYDRGLWSFESAAALALSRPALAHGWLQFRLAEHLTEEQARWLVDEHLGGDPGRAGGYLVSRALEVLWGPDAEAESSTGGVRPPESGDSSTGKVGDLEERVLAELEKPEEVLRRMRSLHPHRSGPVADFESWPAEQLAELEELLLRAFPPAEDPVWDPGEVRPLEGDDDLRALRDDIPPLLYRRDRDGDRTALDRLADGHPSIREWLQDVHTSQGAEGVLAGLGRGGDGPGRKIPLPLLLKLLQDPRYRVLGSADDLLEVLVEQLELIAGDANQHLSLLYHPPAEGKRKRLREDALQAYLFCRLSDRLPAVLEAQGVKVTFIDRETLAARDTRNDLKIQASSHQGKPLTVIVEIKWSDNPEVSTSQVEQLGKDYLLDNGLTHGIYLVGWSGRTVPWKGAAELAPEPRSSLLAWRRSLEEQARIFVQENPGARVVPVVMDLAWKTKLDRRAPAPAPV